jgi:integrase
MARPRRDGRPAAEPNRRNLTELFVKKVRPQAISFNVWDTRERGLVLKVQPTGRRSFYVVYSHRGRPRWYHVGDIPLSDAREIAIEVRLAKARGRDMVAEQRAKRGSGSFAELADRYLEHKKKATEKNKSWQVARGLVERHLLPRWGKLDAQSITRDDAEKLFEGIAAPVMANRVMAAASVIFNWAVKKQIVALNPCRGIDLNKERSRERVLSDSEMNQFWAAFPSAGLLRCSALRMILLTGQRPGEVCRMRREHVRDGWWELPGEPVPALGWPGTKNAGSHRVWLSEAARAILAEVGEDSTTGFVFANARGGPVSELAEAMRLICKQLEVERATPHDLRRTFSTTVTRLGFGREAMNRVTNHRQSSIASVYDRHAYWSEDQRLMEAVAHHVLLLAEGGRPESNVVSLRQA